MRTVAIIQARVSSSRLPGKVLADIAGQPMLARVIERVKRAKQVTKVMVATSDGKDDDPIELICQQYQVPCYRGSLDDVLDRYQRAATVSEAEMVVRITADCPLIDADVIDAVIQDVRERGLEYGCNFLPRPTYPDGLDVEVFTAAALAQAWNEAKTTAEREHVTPYLRLSGKYRTGGITAERDLSHHRWTVDDPADLAFVRRIYDAFPATIDFRTEDVMRLLEHDPDIASMQGTAVGNAGYCKTLYDQAVAGSATVRPIAKSLAMFERARRVIPGAAQTFSKGTTQYVQGVSPVFLERGVGATVWDIDGNQYIDYVQGLLPNILGYAHPKVNAAYREQMDLGHSFSLPHPLEVELAERLTQLIPCAEMVRFGKNGSDATAGAVRIARAFTGRERIACCGYHGWQDWYVGSTPRHIGVPQAVRELTHSFPYNDAAKLDALLSSRPGEFAAVIMEPVNFIPPAVGYLEAVKDIAHQHGAVLIFDEICTGFHFGLGGAQKRFGVTPDLACFGKAMGNGFPISCIVGRADVMQQFEEAFVSFTFAGEVASMAAAMAVLDELEGTDALAGIAAAGRALHDGFNALAACAGLTARLKCIGYHEWPLMKFYDSAGVDCLLTRSLFQQEAVKRGILHLVTFNLSTAHDATIVNRTLEVFAGVMKTLAGWLSDPNPARFLEGPAIEPVFRVR